MAALACRRHVQLRAGPGGGRDAPARCRRRPGRRHRSRPAPTGRGRRAAAAGPGQGADTAARPGPRIERRPARPEDHDEPDESLPRSAPSTVKELRERTGAGFMDCKRALEETGGDLEQGRRAAARAAVRPPPAKKAGREAREGLVSSLHPHRRPASACSSRSTARPTSSPAPTTSRSSSGTSRCRSPASRPQYVTIESIPADDRRAQARRAARRRGGPEEAGGHPREDRGGPAREVVPAGRALRAALPGHRPDGRPARHGRHRADRREHPGAALRRATSSGRSCERRPRRRAGDGRR